MRRARQAIGRNVVERSQPAPGRSIGRLKIVHSRQLWASGRGIDSRRMLPGGGTTIDAAESGPSTPPRALRRATPAVRLVDVRKTYGEVVAVERLSLEVRAGEFFTMLGPSGSGKTTTLRVIAGFELPDAGRIELDGVDVTRSPPYERPVNTVFQDYALFPHMSVLENVAYGLRVQRRRQARARASAPRRRCEMVRLPGVEGRRPDPALGRPAPAGRARARDRQPPARAAARRAARRARSEAAPADAARAEVDPARAQRAHHVHLRHPRPGRGADDERPHRRLLDRAHRAGRHAG